MKPITAFVSLAMLIAGLATDASAAQPYPSQPIKLIAPYPAGGPADIRARWLADKLRPVLGQSIIVDNRPGAGGTIGTETAAKSPPDGYTLVIVHQGTLAMAPHIYPHVGYDPLRDFAPVARLDSSPMMLAVHPAVHANSVTELLRLAKDNPGVLNFGSAGAGTPPHMAGELFRRMAHIDVVHIPYKGAAPALMDLMGGRLTYTIDNMAIQLPQVRAGTIRALAVTGSQRLATLPDIPTVSESGLAGYEYETWMGVSAPVGTPAEIIDRLNLEIAKILATPDARAWFAAQGGVPVIETPEQFARLIKTEHARWGVIIREAGIKIE